MYTSAKFKLQNKARFSQWGREMVWNISPVNEYEARSAIIPFVGTIRKEYELWQQCHFIFVSRRVATPKKAYFSRRQNMPLTVRSHYRYHVISKIFQPSKMLTKTYSLSCAHLSFKINMSLTQTTPPPPGARPTVWEPLLYTLTKWINMEDVHCIHAKCFPCISLNTQHNANESRRNEFYALYQMYDGHCFETSKKEKLLLNAENEYGPKWITLTILYLHLQYQISSRVWENLKLTLPPNYAFTLVLSTDKTLITTGSLEKFCARMNGTELVFRWNARICTDRRTPYLRAFLCLFVAMLIL
jgi:hypothetical protein